MKALCWIGGVLAALIALLALTRLRLTLEYGEAGGSLTVLLGALPVLRLPRLGGAKAAAKPKKKKKKNAEAEEAKKEDRGGSEPGFRRELKIIGDLLGKLKRRLRIDELTLRYLSAGDDPAATALLYGAASAAAAALVRAVEGLFRVKEADVRVSVSFTEPKPRVRARLKLSVSLGVLLWLMANAAVMKKLAHRKAGSK